MPPLTYVTVPCVCTGGRPPGGAANTGRDIRRRRLSTPVTRREVRCIALLLARHGYERQPAHRGGRCTGVACGPAPCPAVLRHTSGVFSMEQCTRGDLREPEEHTRIEKLCDPSASTAREGDTHHQA